MEPETQHIRSMHWSEKIKNAGHNLKYRALSYLQESTPTAILHIQEDAYLVGKLYNASKDNLEQINKAFYDDFRRVPWMTYRAIFPQLSAQNGDNYVTDTGWGCMIRVGQMFAAHSLAKFTKAQTKEQFKPILQLFSDYDKQQMFSIQNIVQLAKQEYQLQAGKWYNPSQISYIIADLFKLHRGNQWRGFEFFILNNATLFYDQIIFKMTGRKELCSCKKQKLVCSNCYKLTQSVSVILLARIGLQSPQKKYLKIINKMMECRLFQGMIGGKPEKALYFLGRIGEDRYIYLDPHIVQQGVGPKNFQSMIDSYFCESFRSCRCSSIDPSIGIGFYLQTLQDLDEFYEHMTKIKDIYPQDFFLFSSVDTPEYMKSEKKDEEPINQLSDTSGFQDIKARQT